MSGKTEPKKEATRQGVYTKDTKHALTNKSTIDLLVSVHYDHETPYTREPDRIFVGEDMSAGFGDDFKEREMNVTPRGYRGFLG